MICKIQKLNKDLPTPFRATDGSVGYDLYANVSEVVGIQAGEKVLIPTGIKIAVESGYEVQIRPRSGLALKYGITVLNTPGTIDSDYRGELGVILINTSDNVEDVFTVRHGDKIAQMVFNKVELPVLEEVDNLDETDRGEGGYGSTDK